MVREVKFVWIEDGAEVEFGDSGFPGIGGSHKFVGFKPAGGKVRGGWLVFLINPGIRTGRPHGRLPRNKTKVRKAA